VMHPSSIRHMIATIGIESAKMVIKNGSICFSVVPKSMT
jgi:hypothetical protein